MSPVTSMRVDELEAEQRELVFPSFDHEDAWTLGVRLVDAARAANTNLAIDIRRPGLILFRSAASGVTPDQEMWIQAKAAVALRFEASSALVAARMAMQEIDPAALRWLALPDFAVTGGSVPIWVANVGVVATVTASGLTSDDDHSFVVHCLRSYLNGLVAGPPSAPQEGHNPHD